ncbi:MAG: hypothetical protein AB7N71_15395 [Phycisphaerae bacterium]
MTSAGIDEDLYCLGCAYNLRGLAGEYLRCPECGSMNSADALRIPAEHINRKLLQLESSAAASVLFIVLTFLIFFVTVLQPRIARYLGVQLLTLGFLVMWSISVWRFRWSCDRQTGWLSLLVEYWFIALFFHSLILTPMLVMLLVDISERAICFLYLFFGVFVVAVILLARPAHRRLQRKMEPLQRSVALRVLQEQRAKIKKWRW